MVPAMIADITEAGYPSGDSFNDQFAAATTIFHSLESKTKFIAIINPNLELLIKTVRLAHLLWSGYGPRNQKFLLNPPCNECLRL